jgi:hypothetical protein
MQLMKNLVTPSFAGNSEGWTTFTQEWDKYINALSNHKKVGDAEKLQLLESCLDENNKRDLAFIIKKAEGRPVSFSEYWAKLTLRYGEDIHDSARKKLRELQLSKEGQIDVEDWRDFQTKFNNLCHDIASIGPEEAYQILVEKFPPFIVNWMVEEQDKRNRRSPKVTISPLGEATKREVQDCIEQLIEERPRDAWVLTAGKWVLQFDAERPIQKLVSLSGKKLRGSDQVLKIAKLAEKMTIEEIFQHIENKFSTRAKQQALNKTAKLNNNNKKIPARGVASRSPSPSVSSSPGSRGGDPKAPQQSGRAPRPQNRGARAARGAGSQPPPAAPPPAAQAEPRREEAKPPAQPVGAAAPGQRAPTPPRPKPLEIPTKQEAPPQPNAWNNGPPNANAGKGFDNGKGKGKGFGKGAVNSTFVQNQNTGRGFGKGFGYGKGMGKGNGGGPPHRNDRAMGGGKRSDPPPRPAALAPVPTPEYPCEGCTPARGENGEARQPRPAFPPDPSACPCIPSHPNG